VVMPLAVEITLELADWGELKRLVMLGGVTEAAGDARRGDAVMRRSKTQRGVALITVMLVVALATTAAVNMAGRQQLDIRRTENVLYQGQALMYLLGVESWARQFLSDDRRKNKIDHLGEDWAVRLPPLPIEGGQLMGFIDDLQGRCKIATWSPASRKARKKTTIWARRPPTARPTAPWPAPASCGC